MKKILLITCSLLALLSTAVQALEVPDKSGRRFHNDSAELVLSPNQADAVEERLAQIEAGCPGVQMGVLVLDSLGGEPMEDFSLRVAEKWKLGRKRDKGGDGDKGLLLVIAVKDKKYRFEVGYGLEQILPDSAVGSIGREELVPGFKEVHFLEGIYRAIESVRRRVSRDTRRAPGSVAIPPLGDKRFHNAGTLRRIPDFEVESLENSLDRFEFGLENMPNMRMAILVIDSLGGEPIDSLATRAAEEWKLGRKGGDGTEGDNGLLLVLAMKERKYRFEIGEKIKDLFPETLMEAVARDIMIQDFWAGEYARGLRYTIDAVTSIAEGQYPQSVELAERKDDRGTWERLTDFIQYGTFSHPTSYDYLYGSKKKVDPAWGRAGGVAQSGGHSRCVLAIMILAAGVFGFFHFLLGGAVGLVEGAAFSWLYVGHAWPVLLLAAAIGLVIGMVSKYLAAVAVIIGIGGGSDGGGFGGGGAGGSW